MKVAIAQLAPSFLDRERGLARVVDAVQEAAANGAQLVAFGETLVPAYPLWLSGTGGARFNDPVQKGLHRRYLEQGVQMQHLGPVLEAAGRCGIAVVLGVAERSRERSDTLYASRVFISERGELLSVHRKLVPTYEERLAWGPGDGAGLRVHPVGEFQVGALNCWENWMPLARAALYAQGEDLHVMLWPGSASLTRDLTPVVARELRGFVLSASAWIRLEDLPEDLRALMGDEELAFDGGSCIAGPDGAWLVEPCVHQEALLYAELDHGRVLEERQNFSPAGHYCRPDVLELRVNRRRQSGAVFDDSET